MSDALTVTVVVQNRAIAIPVTEEVSSIVRTVVRALRVTDAYSDSLADDDKASFEIRSSVITEASIEIGGHSLVNGHEVPTATAEALRELRERLFVYGAAARVFIG